MGRIIPYMKWKINMFQTTNQINHLGHGWISTCFTHPFLALTDSGFPLDDSRGPYCCAQVNLISFYDYIYTYICVCVCNYMYNYMYMYMFMYIRYNIIQYNIM